MLAALQCSPKGFDCSMAVGISCIRADTIMERVESLVAKHLPEGTNQAQNAANHMEFEQVYLAQELQAVVQKQRQLQETVASNEQIPDGGGHQASQGI